MKNKNWLVAAALAGIALGGATACSSGAVATGECQGVNGCKGKGDCSGKGHGCAGQNSCKSKGWKKTTEAECQQQGGKFGPHSS